MPRRGMFGELCGRGHIRITPPSPRSSAFQRKYRAVNRNRGRLICAVDDMTTDSRAEEGRKYQLLKSSALFLDPPIVLRRALGDLGPGQVLIHSVAWLGPTPENRPEGPGESVARGRHAPTLKTCLLAGGPGRATWKFGSYCQRSALGQGCVEPSPQHLSVLRR